MIKTSFRLEESTVEQIKQLAEHYGTSQGGAVRIAVQSAVQSDVQGAVHENPQETAPDTDWKSLYLEEKKQNRELTEKLLELTGKVADSLQAAQALQAMDKPSLESVEQKQERKTRWKRIREAWRG